MKYISCPFGTQFHPIKCELKDDTLLLANFDLLQKAWGALGYSPYPHYWYQFRNGFGLSVFKYKKDLWEYAVLDHTESIAGFYLPDVAHIFNGALTPGNQHLVHAVVEKGVHTILNALQSHPKIFEFDPLYVVYSFSDDPIPLKPVQADEDKIDLF